MGNLWRSLSPTFTRLSKTIWPHLRNLALRRKGQPAEKSCFVSHRKFMLPRLRQRLEVARALTNGLKVHLAKQRESHPRALPYIAKPCIFQNKNNRFFEEGSLSVVVAGCGQVGRGSRGGQRISVVHGQWAASSASSNCPLVHSLALRLFSRSVRQT